MVNFQNCGTHTILMKSIEAESRSHHFSREYPEEKEIHRNESDINIGQGLSIEPSEPGFGLSDKYFISPGHGTHKVVEPIEDIDLVFEESSEIPDTLENVEIGIQTNYEALHSTEQICEAELMFGSANWSISPQKNENYKVLQIENQKGIDIFKVEAAKSGSNCCDFLEGLDITKSRIVSQVQNTSLKPNSIFTYDLTMDPVGKTCEIIKKNSDLLSYCNVFSNTLIEACSLPANPSPKRNKYSSLKGLSIYPLKLKSFENTIEHFPSIDLEEKEDSLESASAALHAKTNVSKMAAQIDKTALTIFVWDICSFEELNIAQGSKEEESRLKLDENVIDSSLIPISLFFSELAQNEEGSVSEEEKEADNIPPSTELQNTIPNNTTEFSVKLKKNSKPLLLVIQDLGQLSIEKSLPNSHSEIETHEEKKDLESFKSTHSPFFSHARQLEVMAEELQDEPPSASEVVTPHFTNLILPSQLSEKTVKTFPTISFIGNKRELAGPVRTSEITKKIIENSIDLLESISLQTSSVSEGETEVPKTGSFGSLSQKHGWEKARSQALDFEIIESLNISCETPKNIEGKIFHYTESKKLDILTRKQLRFKENLIFKNSLNFDHLENISVTFLKQEGSPTVYSRKDFITSITCENEAQTEDTTILDYTLKNEKKLEVEKEGVQSPELKLPTDRSTISQITPRDTARSDTHDQVSNKYRYFCNNVANVNIVKPEVRPLDLPYETNPIIKKNPFRY
eukprot:TRINITY_DN2013_c0_g1_i4.p1 TRINITY_DN2013_c0_g1~~TRINITY_DN2013_c0_g1_i4.p1  ORF type:complete len:742 (+),score=138.00 TRINITY_DN2013_c0_g1_i4:1243-3468(+)